MIDNGGVVFVDPGADFDLGPFASAKEHFAEESYEKLTMVAKKYLLSAQLWQARTLPHVSHNESILLDSTSF